MKSTTTKILGLLLAASFFACNGNQPKTEGVATESAITATDYTSTMEALGNETAMTLNAQFMEFILGDSEHYMFKDKSGKEWDFSGCEDASVQFGIELPEEEANTTNQGWSSNKSLQNKWFDLKYVVKRQPLYLEGPIGDVQVIIEANLVQ
jgi:hypothetical protein